MHRQAQILQTQRSTLPDRLRSVILNGHLNGTMTVPMCEGAEPRDSRPAPFVYTDGVKHGAADTGQVQQQRRSPFHCRWPCALAKRSSATARTLNISTDQRSWAVRDELLHSDGISRPRHRSPIGTTKSPAKIAGLFLLLWLLVRLGLRPTGRSILLLRRRLRTGHGRRGRLLRRRSGLPEFLAQDRGRLRGTRRQN